MNTDHVFTLRIKQARVNSAIMGNRKALIISTCAISAGISNMKKDIRAVTTPVTAPIMKEPLNIPRKTPTDLKNAAASKAWVFSPVGW